MGFLNSELSVCNVNEFRHGHSWVYCCECQWHKTCQHILLILHFFTVEMLISPTWKQKNYPFSLDTHNYLASTNCTCCLQDIKSVCQPHYYTLTSPLQSRYKVGLQPSGPLGSPPAVPVLIQCNIQQICQTWICTKLAWNSLNEHRLLDFVYKTNS